MSRTGRNGLLVLSEHDGSIVCPAANNIGLKEHFGVVLEAHGVKLIARTSDPVVRTNTMPRTNRGGMAVGREMKHLWWKVVTMGKIGSSKLGPLQFCGVGGARGSRTLTTLRSGDFKSPASTIPPSPQKLARTIISCFRQSVNNFGGFFFRILVQSCDL